MSEFRVTHRTVLGERQPVLRNGVSLEALPEGTVLQLLAKVDQASATVSPHVVSAGLSLREASPGQWFAVGDKSLSRDGLAAINTALVGVAGVIDQSHGRVRIRMRGPLAVTVLQKGTAVDFDLSAFPITQSTTTLIGHIAVHLTRIESDVFELMVLRGFAESLWDDLTQMSVEFS